MPAEWDHGRIHGAIAESTRCVLPAEDPLPDMLINRAQELGIRPGDLRAWIYEELPYARLRYALLLDALSDWAKRTHLISEGPEQ